MTRSTWESRCATRSVWVSGERDLDIVLHSKRAGTLRPDVITTFGIELGRKKIAVCKMWRHGVHGFSGVVVFLSGLVLLVILGLILEWIGKRRLSAS